MCYPKPGPRCSAHAAYEYTKAHQRVLVIYNERKAADAARQAKLREQGKFSLALDSKIEAAIQRRNKAAAEYEITPAGIRALERNLATSSEVNKQYAEERLQEAVAKRAARIAAVKADGKPVNHRRKAITAALMKDLSETGSELRGIEDEDPEVAAAIAESARWSTQLTDEEIDTMRWYTEDGYALINTYLNTGKVNTRFTSGDQDEATVKQTITLMDSALAKQPPGEEKIVYRRHMIYDADTNFSKDMSIESQQQIFTPGEEFSPGIYMSTSFDPHNAPGREGGIVFFQIKTRSAVSLSAVHSQGTNEKEYLIPRTARFRIVSNDTKLVIYPKASDKDNPGKDGRTITTIQLEEIPIHELPASQA